jgi:hypothetical protein
MQAVGIILLLISIGTVVGPIGAVVITYANNPIQMVVPPELTNVISNAFQGSPQSVVDNNTNINSEGNNETIPNHGDNGSNNIGIDNPGGSFLAPVLVGAEVDNASRTFSVTVNFTNTFGFDLTLNEVSANVVCNQHNFQLGSVGLAEPVALFSDQTAQITVSGSWTQEAENHVQTDHAGATSIEASLTNLKINVNGLTIEQPGPISVGSIPLS